MLPNYKITSPISASVKDKPRRLVYLSRHWLLSLGETKSLHEPLPSLLRHHEVVHEVHHVLPQVAARVALLEEARVVDLARVRCGVADLLGVRGGSRRRLLVGVRDAQVLLKLGEPAVVAQIPKDRRTRVFSALELFLVVSLTHHVSPLSSDLSIALFITTLSSLRAALSSWTAMVAARA